MINRTHGGNIWRYPEPSRGSMLDFSVNTNPLGICRKIKNSIVRNVDKIDYYPDPESKCLKNRLAKFHALSSHNFLIGNGSIELIHMIPRALGAKVVLIPTPTFSEYEFAAKANNAKCVYVKGSQNNNFELDMPEMLRHIPKADMVFLCNPNNPTGYVLGRREIVSLLNMCKKYSKTLVIDEAFMDFVDHEDRVDMGAEAAKTKRLLVLRSLTKFFVLPGIRIGYVIGHKDTINKLSRCSYPWNVNTIAQIAAEEAVGDKQYIARTEDIVPRQRAYLHEKLNRINGIMAYPSCTNFLLCRLEGGEIKNVAELCKRLADRGILIRRCDNFRGLNDKFFRVAVKDRKANVILISALRAIFE